MASPLFPSFSNHFVSFIVYSIYSPSPIVHHEEGAEFLPNYGTKSLFPLQKSHLYVILDAKFWLQKRRAFGLTQQFFTVPMPMNTRENSKVKIKDSFLLTPFSPQPPNICFQVAQKVAWKIQYSSIIATQLIVLRGVLPLPLQAAYGQLLPSCLLFAVQLN